MKCWKCGIERDIATACGLCGERERAFKQLVELADRSDLAAALLSTFTAMRPVESIALHASVHKAMLSRLMAEQVAACATLRRLQMKRDTALVEAERLAASAAYQAAEVSIRATMAPTD